MPSIEIPDTGQTPLLEPPSQHVQLNKHLCVNCDDMVQRFTYAKYFYRHILPSNTRMQFPVDKRKTPLYRLQPNFHAVSVSANHGCHICSLFVNQFQIRRRGNLDLETSPDTSDCIVGLLFNRTPKVEGALYDLVMTFEIFSLKKSVSLKLQLRPIEGQEIPIIGVPERGLKFPVIDTRTCTYAPTAHEKGHSCRLETIYEWLEECLKHHKLCRSVSEAASKLGTPPARLIDIGLASDFSDLRLLDVSLDLPLPRWVTLSHCWGPPGSISLRLLQSNVDELKKQIPFGSLTKNFKDAIMTARHLAERFGTLYLWIDAICIIQDSDSDWARESIKMGHLYSNSLCTLFACRGTDPSAGLWEPPTALSMHECCIEGGPNSCLRGRWQIRDIYAFENSVQRSHLCSRAWVHQEDNLATRRLYLASGQLYWGCCQGIKQEMNPKLVLLKPSLSANTGGHSLLAIQCDPDLTRQQKLDKTYSIWLEIAAHHSGRGITRATDRLPSVAAMAKVIGDWQKSPDDYIAGTWKNFFWACILWEIRSPDKATKAENGSPSWSWTSVTGAIHFVIRPAYIFGTNRKLEAFCPEATYAEFHFQPAQPNFVMGGLLGASVKVRGRVLRLKMHARVETDRHIPLLAKFHYNGQELPTNLIPCLDYMSDWRATGDFDVFALVVARDRDYEGTESSPTKERLFCLVLRKAEALEAVYTRCGAFQIADLRPEAPWSKLLEEQARTVELKGKTEYHELHGGGIYTITLR